MTGRYDRQTRFFGAEGQQRLEGARVVLLGTGGLGMHVIQQLGYLGVSQWAFVEDDVIEDTNLNRLVGAVPDDVGKLKVRVATRLVKSLHPDAEPVEIVGRVGDPEHEDAIKAVIAMADLVIGCFDKEAPRLKATMMCSTAGVPYLDVATEILPEDGELIYGGRVVFSHDGTGCLVCLDVLDMNEVTLERMPTERRAERDRIYGIDHDELGGSGPSVVMLNGVVASLACMEAMAFLTGLRPPARQLTYLGDKSVVRKNSSEGQVDCAFCHAWRTTTKVAEATRVAASTSDGPKASAADAAST